VRSLGIIITVIVALNALFGDKARSRSTADFIETHIQAPVQDISPIGVLGHFKEEMFPPCEPGRPWRVDYDPATGRTDLVPPVEEQCRPWLLRPLWAVPSTARYVFTQGWATVAVIGVPAVLYAALLGLAARREPGIVGYPLVLLTVGVGLPLFSGVFGLLLQFLVLAVVLAVKYAILASVVLGGLWAVFQAVRGMPKREQRLAELEGKLRSWLGRTGAPATGR